MSVIPQLLRSRSTPRPSLPWTLAIVSLGLLMTTLDNLVVTTALPAIRRSPGASIQSLEWTVNAYTLTFAVLLLTGAALGDRLGRRRMFAVGLTIFTAASAAAAVSASTDALIAARALQGLGAAIVLPLTLTLLSEAVPPARRGMALGIWGGVSGLGVAIGPLVGGAVVSGISGGSTKERRALALDLLDQRSPRTRPRAVGADQAQRITRPERAPGPARAGAGRTGPAGHHLCRDPRPGPRLRSPVVG